MNLLTKILKQSRRFGVDCVRYNHRTRMASDSRYALGSLLAETEVRTIFDLGANIGQSAMGFRRQFPAAKIFSLELGDEAFRELEEACKDDTNVQLYKEAVSDIDGFKEFFISHDDTCNSLLEPSTTIRNESISSKLSLVGKKKVPCRMLSTFCREHDIRDIDLLKMDIQGGELMAISGASELFVSGSIKVVYCEVLFSAMYKNACGFSDISEAMKQFGYSLYGLYNLQHYLTDGLLWADAIFVSPLISAK